MSDQVGQVEWQESSRLHNVRTIQVKLVLSLFPCPFREYQRIFNQLAAADVETITELTGCLRLVRHNVTFAVQCDLKDFLCASKLFVIMRPERHNFTFGVKFDLKDILSVCQNPWHYATLSKAVQVSQVQHGWRGLPFSLTEFLNVSYLRKKPSNQISISATRKV